MASLNALRLTKFKTKALCFYFINSYLSDSSLRPIKQGLQTLSRKSPQASHIFFFFFCFPLFYIFFPPFCADDFPKPQITVQPETQSAIKGSNLSFICSAASSSDSPMTFAWKKDNELLQDAEMENYAHLRAQGGEVMEYTTILRLRNVEFSNEGKYQCVISNHFGSSYSVKAKLTVNSTYVTFCMWT